MTLIKPKYTYEKLKRVEVDGKRRYAAPGGAPVASVTTILSNTKDMTHLIEWKRRVGEKKAQEIVTEASGVGTRMHHYLEKYVETGEWPQPGSNPYAQQAHKMASQIRENVLDSHVTEIWGSEVQLYHPKIYAGTTDCVGIHKGEGAILDFKQSNKPKKREWIEDYFLQLAAYAEAHNEVHGTDIRKGVVLMCTKDYQYQEFISEGAEFEMWRTLWWQRVEQYYKKYR